MKNTYIIKIKNYKRGAWVIENARTKKQAFKKFRFLSGLFKLSFKDFLDDFIIYKY